MSRNRRILALVVLATGLSWAASSAEAPATQLTNAQQILDLGREAAGRTPHPVLFRGVVTYPSIDVRGRVYVQDGSAGLMVGAVVVPFKLEPGQRVEVTGTTARGDLFPYVANATLELLGRAPLPEPIRTTPRELARGMHFGHRVAVPAVIRDLRYARNRIQLLCANEGQLFIAGVVAPAVAPLPWHWLDARVELRGNTWVTLDNLRRPVSFSLAVYDTNEVTVIRPGGPDPFTRPLVAARDLARAMIEPDSRVRVAGIVTSWSPDGWITLRDETGPLAARRLDRLADVVPPGPPAVTGSSPAGAVNPEDLRPAAVALNPGDRIELVGAPTGEHSVAPRLVDADYRVLGHGTAPAPQGIAGRELASGRFDAELVQFKARLTDYETPRGDGAGGRQNATLWLEADGNVVEAHLDANVSDQPPLNRDSLLLVTGVCLAQTGESKSARSIRLQLRSAGDIKVLRASAPLVTTATARIFGGAGALVALALGWVGLLRRQVARQTAALRGANTSLRREVEQRTRAERALQERVRLSSLSAEVALALNAGDELRPMLERCARLLVQHLDVTLAQIWTSNDATQALELEASSGDPSEFDGSNRSLQLAESALSQLAGQGKPYLLGNESAGPEGDWFRHDGLVASAGHPLKIEGRVLGIVAVFSRRPLGDDTLPALAPVAHSLALGLQRKRAEARLRDSEERFSKAFLGSSARLAILDAATGRYLDVNDAFVEGYGYSREEALGRTSLELGLWQNPEDRAAAYRIYEREGRLRGFESRLRTRTGELRTVLQSGDFIKLGDRRCILSVGVDITDRKQAELETQKALAREKELSELKSSFVSMVSHEFRTPLGVIQSASDVLDRYLDRLSPEKRRKHLDMIFRSTKNLAQLVEGVLLLGKAEDGRMQFAPVPLNLAAACAQIVDEVHSATGRSSPIELSAGADLEEARSDADLLRHILANLLSNAVKYSSPGTPVQLTVERRGSDAVFTVRDRGIGIPEADQANLFKIFARGGNVGARPGTGLGLVIVQRCVQLHGGEVTVTSQPGEGTTVTVTLPAFPT